MSFSPIPQYSFQKLTDISPDYLERLGVRFLMLDLDNTIASYRERLPSADVLRWASELIDRGIQLYMVTNSFRKRRVKPFAEALGIGVSMGAGKPSPKCIIRAMEMTGHERCDSAFVGDQIFTDILSANRAGVVSIIVKPKHFTNPFLALRYGIEAPFRAMCKNIFRD